MSSARCHAFTRSRGRRSAHGGLPRRDAWLHHDAQARSAAAAPGCGGRRHPRTQRRREQRKKAFCKLKHSRDALLASPQGRQAAWPIGPPPGLEVVQRAAVADHHPWALGQPEEPVEQLQLQIAQLTQSLKVATAELEAQAAMGEAAIYHAIQE